MNKSINNIIIMYIISIIFGSMMIYTTFYITAYLKRELQIDKDVMMSFHDLVKTIVSTVIGSQSIGVCVYNALKK